MSATAFLDLDRARTAWQDRIRYVTNTPVAVKSIVRWDPAADGDDLTAGRDGYTLTIPCTEVAHGELARHADTLARDVNRHVEIHPDADPTYLRVMVWLDMPSPTWCGARSTVDPDGMTVFCDREPFHQDPYIASDPEDGEQITYSGNPHHAPIPSSFSYGKQGDQYWDVGPLHVIPEDPWGVRKALEELESADLTDDERAERDATSPAVFEHRRSERQWNQVRDRLAAQLKHHGEWSAEQRADELMTSAAVDIERDNAIVTARKKLWEMADDAHGSTGVALRALDELLNSPAYDIEYADDTGEGNETAEQIRSLLTNARRDLAAVRALMPTNRNGDMKPSNHTG